MVPAESTQPFLSLLCPSLPLATTWPLLPTGMERESLPVWRVREADSTPLACHFWKLLRAAGQGVLQEPVCQMKTASCRVDAYTSVALQPQIAVVFRVQRPCLDSAVSISNGVEEKLPFLQRHCAMNSVTAAVAEQGAAVPGQWGTNSTEK